MAASILRALSLCALALPFSYALAQHVHVEEQSILLEAQSFDLDYKNNNMIYHKVRIAQGAMSVTADQAQASGLNFETSSHWVFHGNVKIAMEGGQLTSDEADVTFANKLLAKAVANGNPATFEQRIVKTGKVAHGRAETIDYDVTKNMVHLSKNAWVSDGDREIQGESLTYNVLTQTIRAESAEQGSQRVHIIITPPAKSKP
jgi:lipopolysaccharide transport protein LptA